MKKQNEARSRYDSKMGNKGEPKVTLNLQPGRISPAQREAGRKLWARLLKSTK